MPETTTIAIVSKGKSYVINRKGKTVHIMEAIKEADKYSIAEVKDLARELQGDTVEESCINIYNWVTTHIPYVEDENGEQCIQMPADVIRNRKVEYGGTGAGADCKSMAMLCSALLRAQGNYEFLYRGTSAEAKEDLHHIYLIVKDGKCYIPLDCTPDEDGQLWGFGEEFPFKKKNDFAPAKPAPGFGNMRRAYVGATQEEYEGQKWAAWTKPYTTDIAGLTKEVKARALKGIELFWGDPISAYGAKMLLSDYWKDWMRLCSVLIYRHWFDTTIMQGNLQSTVVPFPPYLQAKKEEADKLYEDLKKTGIRDSDIDDMTRLSVWNNYNGIYSGGMSMEYLLYRCKCRELYGQEWAPAPGVPYWDANQGILKTNGGSFEQAVMIAMCFPVGGGIGKPIGETYWCVGGYVMANGADQGNTGKKGATGALSNWIKNNPRPEGIANNGEGIDADWFAKCLALYNEWKQGHMVVIPDPALNNAGKRTTTNQGKKVGNPAALIGVIVGIITAILSGLSAVMPHLMKIIGATKSNPNWTRDNLPEPVTDFKLAYKTVDGCYIGYNTAGSTTCNMAKICNGEIVACDGEIDLRDPKNQPPAGNGINGLTGSTGLLIGGGLAAAGLAYLLTRKSK